MTELKRYDKLKYFQTNNTNTIINIDGVSRLLEDYFIKRKATNLYEVSEEVTDECIYELFAVASSEGVTEELANDYVAKLYRRTTSDDL